ncbi:MAG: 16S rRNA (guanine(527)-N(7))-methyltransferase RsmG [Bacteroidales bacterium]
MEIITKYFPDLTDLQQKQILSLQELYSYWNQQINVISRKDIEHLYERHVLHSLSLAKALQPVANTKFLDVGTGGGFPGIPLAILFPQCQFHLVDSIGKKVKVAQEVANSLNLQNIRFTHSRAEEIKDTYDFVISRAVTELSIFVNWIWKNVSPTQKNSIKNGVLYLKGGDLTKELQLFKHYKIIDLSDLFDEDFFFTKKIVHLTSIKR